MMSTLTKSEKEWLDKLQRVLNECPSKRLGFYTIGDPSIEVYDCSKDKEINVAQDYLTGGEFCTHVAACDADFYYTLKFPSAVNSTCG